MKTRTLAAVFAVSALALTPKLANAQLAVSNPMEWMALAEGNDAINDQMQKQIDGQTKTSLLQNAMAAEFTKIKEWEGKYISYLQKTDGFASQLKASATLYEDGVRIFIMLGKIKNAISENPQGIAATMSMNNLYMETATELISVYTVLKEAKDKGGKGNMLTGTERSEMLWSLTDKLESFSKKMNRLCLSLKYYNMTDVWNRASAGMIDRNMDQISNSALERWKRAGKTVK